MSYLYSRYLSSSFKIFNVAFKCTSMYQRSYLYSAYLQNSCKTCNMAFMCTEHRSFLYCRCLHSCFMTPNMHVNVCLVCVPNTAQLKVQEVSTTIQRPNLSSLTGLPHLSQATYTLPTGHTALWYDANNLNRHNVTCILFLYLYQPAAWPSEYTELWKARGQVCSAVIWQETTPFFK
jgi:hypothetical protein